MPTYNPSYQYNFNPTPTQGNGAFGLVPGQVAAPQPAQDLAGQVGNLPYLNQSAGNDILAGLNGQLSPGTRKLIQDQSAAYGVASGMPGSGLAQNRTLRDLGLTSEQVQNQALGQLNAYLGQTSQTQTVNPALQAEIASSNANLAAAPNPGEAQGYAQSLLSKYLKSIGGSGGGSTGRPTGGSAFAPVQTGVRGASDYIGGGGGGSGSTLTRTPASTFNDLGLFDYGGGQSGAQTPYTQDQWSPLSNYGYPQGSGLEDILGPDLSSLYGQAPANTVSTSDQSSYDPYAGYGGYDF